MLGSIRDFIRGPIGALVALVSAGVTIVAVIKFVQHHPRIAWMWLFIGAVVVIALAFSRFHQMRKERDDVKRLAGTITQTMVQAEGDVTGRLDVQGNRMTIGSGTATSTRRGRRWFSRILSEEERQGLADRCDACSHEALEFLHRPEPGYSVWGSEDERRAQDAARDAHQAETEQRFQSQFVTRIRDLLNECAEAGYAFDAEVERLRVGGDVGWHDKQTLAEAVGAAGHRVRRGSKKL
jgi:hypothetical protein